MMRKVCSTLFILLSAVPLAAGPIPLTPSTTIDVSSGTGIGSGVVSTLQEIWDFNAVAGNSVTLDINVTQMYPGLYFTDDDTMLFLFDGTGVLLASDDDSGEGDTSIISNYVLPATGTYYAAVTTFSRQPLLDGSGIITGWGEEGGSNVAYDLVISGLTAETPEPGTMALCAAGFAALLAVLRRR